MKQLECDFAKETKTPQEINQILMNYLLEQLEDTDPSGDNRLIDMWVAKGEP